MSSAYELERGQIIAALEGLLRTKELVVERAEIVWKALRTFQTANVDFADCLLERSAAAAGCEGTMTLDRGAAKNAGMTLLV
jgi:predicted nucleic-acid-binding protein